MEAALILQLSVFIAALLFQMSFFKAGILHPNMVYLFFHGLVFVARPIIVVALNFQNIYQRMGFFPTETQAIATLLIADLGLVSFIAASSLVSWRQRILILPSATVINQMLQDKLLRKSFLVSVVILIGPVVWSSIHFLLHPLAEQGSSYGGTEMTRDAATGAMLQTGSTAYLLDLQFVGGPLAISWAMLNRFRFFSLLPLGLYFIIRMSDGHGRFSFILLSAAAAFVLLVFKRRRWPTLSIVAAACVLMVVFSVLGNDRHAVKRSLGLMNHDEAQALSAVDQRGKRLEDNSVFGPDFANFEYLTYVVSNIPEKSGTYSYFLQYAELLTKPIPRILWPGKPVGSWLNPVNLNSFGNFSALTVGLVGDGWISLGIAGVIITLSISGGICGFVYNWFSRRCYKSMMVIIGYCVALSLFPQWFRDGSISIVEFEATHLAPVLLWAFLYTRMRQSRSSVRGSGIVRQKRAGIPVRSPSPVYGQRFVTHQRADSLADQPFTELANPESRS